MSPKPVEGLVNPFGTLLVTLSLLQDKILELVYWMILKDNGRYLKDVTTNHQRIIIKGNINRGPSYLYCPCHHDGTSSMHARALATWLADDQMASRALAARCVSLGCSMCCMLVLNTAGGIRTQ